MKRVFWVRHGPTHQKTFVGWRDVPADLSDHAAVSRLSQFLPAEATVASSDLIRATQTASAISEGRTMLTAMKSFREFDFGEWDGLDYKTVSSRHPTLSRRFWEEPGDLRAPGGESWNDVARRVNFAVDRLLMAHSGDLIVVAHIGVIMTQIARTGGTPYQAMGHKIDNLSVTELHSAGGSWTLEKVNHIP